jgi:Flp pilus assembly protein CpaB
MGKPSLGGMLATRQGALTLAVLCAACAAGILMLALSSYKQGVHTAVTAPKQATVLVATGEIQKNTAGDQVAADKLYKSTAVTPSQLAAGAISDAALLQGKVAQSNILPGQQLTTTDFAATATATGLLSPNQRAISVPTDTVHGDLGVLEPGDHVDLYAEMTNGSGLTISLLAPDVLVINTPTGGLASALTTASKTASASSGSPTLVFAVSDAIVPSLELTADAGKVWVALRPANATSPQGGVTTVNSVLARALLAATPSAANSKGTNP